MPADSPGRDTPAPEDDRGRGLPAPRSEIPCRMCGACCGPFFALYVEEDDERRWERDGRKDLLDRLSYERERVRWDRAAPYNCETGETFSRCVFTVVASDGRVICGIHDTKPRICRDYPPESSELCRFFRRPRP